MGFLTNIKSRIFGGNVSDLTVQEASVGDELAAAGKAFGTLMEQVGLAVAHTQQQLDKNGAAIAEEMCKTEVEMIRARETIYGDDGKIKDIKIVTGKGKLIELASPVFYEHKFVAVQGEFTATELATSSQTKVRQASVGAGATVGNPKKGLFSRPGSGSVSASASASFSDVTSGTTFDSSVGTMRMNVLIAPKDSIGIPKPPLILVGPKIAINALGPSTDATTGNRTVDVSIVVTKKDGSVNDGKLLLIDADGIDWEVVPSTDPPKTDTQGELHIRLKRSQTPGGPPLESKQSTVTVRLGLVTASATVTV